MASYQQHLAQWTHNRSFLSAIAASPRHPDWIITATFYVCLHAVDTLLVHDGVTGVNSHGTRNFTLAQTNRYANVWKCYRPLHDLSRKVRYLADPSEWVPLENIERDIFKRYFYPLERSVVRLLKQNVEFPPIVLAKT